MLPGRTSFLLRQSKCCSKKASQSLIIQVSFCWRWNERPLANVIKHRVDCGTDPAVRRLQQRGCGSEELWLLQVFWDIVHHSCTRHPWQRKKMWGWKKGSPISNIEHLHHRFLLFLTPLESGKNCVAFLPDSTPSSKPQIRLVMMAKLVRM